MRGIRNTTGVSCHLACALQVLCHSVPWLTQILKEVALDYLSPVLASPDWLSQDDLVFHRLIHSLGVVLGELGQILQEGELEPVDPVPLYNALKETTSLDPDDVGDVATAIQTLLWVLRMQDSNDYYDWDNLVQMLLLSGESCQKIIGKKTEKVILDATTICRQVTRLKIGKRKQMPCPYPLVGSFESLEEAIQQLAAPTAISRYSWEKQAAESYHEDIVELAEGKILSRDTTGEWQTSKVLQIESVPRSFLLSLDRFSYTRDGERTFKNQSITIPLHLEASDLLQDIPDVSKKYGSLALTSAVLHVVEDSIDEEGHYVTLICQHKDPSAEWVLIDDEKCKGMDMANALRMIQGGNDEQGRFCCATLVAYTQLDIVTDWESDLVSLNSRLLDQYQRLKDAIPAPVDWSVPQSLVGRRLRVRWSKGKYYAGKVESYNTETGNHIVMYDDGDRREYVLLKKTIVWLS